MTAAMRFDLGSLIAPATWGLLFLLLALAIGARAALWVHLSWSALFLVIGLVGLFLASFAAEFAAQRRRASSSSSPAPSACADSAAPSGTPPNSPPFSRRWR